MLPRATTTQFPLGGNWLPPSTVPTDSQQLQLALPGMGALEPRKCRTSRRLEFRRTTASGESLADAALRWILERWEAGQSRLGQELHEGLSQQLAGLALLSNVLAAKLRREGHPESPAASEIAELIGQTILCARDLAKAFYPVELECGGILTALQAIAQQTRLQFHIGCELRHQGPAPQLVGQAGIHLYRIVQESIGNAIEHGGAQHIVIESRARGGVQVVSVTDDGRGFGQPTPGKQGLGLYLMEYRARLIGGKIAVEQVASGGCRVICSLGKRPMLD